MLTWLVDNFVLLKDEKWRPIWFVWAGGSLVCLWLFFWWSVGLFPIDAFGAGFARAEDVASVRIQLLENSLLDSRIKQCEAPTSQVRQFYAQRIQTKLREYTGLTSRDYQLPTCEELIGPQQ